MTIVAFIRQSYALSLYIFGAYIKMIKFNEYINILFSILTAALLGGFIGIITQKNSLRKKEMQVLY